MAGSTQNVASEFLVFALKPHRDRLVTTAREGNYAHAEFHKLKVTGVPKLREISLFASPHPLGRPSTLIIDVVRLDDSVLAAPVELRMRLTEHEIPPPGEEIPPVEVKFDEPEEPASVQDKITINELRWMRIAPAEVKEVQAIDTSGRPVLANVDTSKYPWRLICPRCGRARDARRNSIYQIYACRVCTGEERRRRRSVAQFQRRATWRRGKAVKARIRELYETGKYTQGEVARLCDVSPSWVCKVLAQ